MPATIISTEANGDGGYEGQYALSANHPMIARIKLVGRSSQPIETESVAVDDFAAANGGLDPTVPPQDDDSETASVKPESRPRRIVGKSPRRRRLKSM